MFIFVMFSYIQPVAHKCVCMQHRTATITSLCPEDLIQSEENSAHHDYRQSMEDIKLRFLL
jgi:Pyruvate/2-oxoacid:ferredoxin oxidoreductase delta subunit